MVKYDKDYLQTIVDRDGCIIIEPTSDKLHAHSRIYFKCHCGVENDKKFQNIVKQLALCKLHTKQSQKNKTKITSLERYGVESPNQSQEVKDKSKKTCLENYGVENPSQSQEVKHKKIETSLKNYGVEYPIQTQEIKDKYKTTCLEKYGVVCSLQSQEVQDKSKITCLEKYGVEHNSQAQEIKDKKIATSLKKYGVENPNQSQEVKDKKIENSLKKYGVENPFQSQEVRDKCITTSMERYGVEHPMQNSDIAEKSSKCAYKTKKYTFPCGKIVDIQGNEDLALDELVASGLTSNDIVNSRGGVPEIWWKDENGKNHRYYVDIYIPSLNKMIEVKSTWTFEKTKDKTINKGKACIDNRFGFELWVYHNNNKSNKKVIIF